MRKIIVMTPLWGLNEPIYIKSLGQCLANGNGLVLSSQVMYPEVPWGAAVNSQECSRSFYLFVCLFIYLCPALVRNNWKIKLYIVQVSTMMVWHACTLCNDYQDQDNEQLHHFTLLTLSCVFVCMCWQCYLCSAHFKYTIPFYQLQAPCHAVH